MASLAKWLSAQFKVQLQPRCSHLNFRYRAFLRKEFLDIPTTLKCEFTLKRVHDIDKNIQLKDNSL